MGGVDTACRDRNIGSIWVSSITGEDRWGEGLTSSLNVPRDELRRSMSEESPNPWR